MPTIPMSGNRCPEGQELWSGDNTCRTLYTFYYKARRVVAGGNEVCSYHQQYALEVQNAENILLRNLGGPLDIWNIDRIDEERYRRNWDNNSCTERMRMGFVQLTKDKLRSLCSNTINFMEQTSVLFDPPTRLGGSAEQDYFYRVITEEKKRYSEGQERTNKPSKQKRNEERTGKATISKNNNLRPVSTTVDDDNNSDRKS